MDSPRRNDQGVETWDAPVRLFHWALMCLVIAQIASVSIGGNAMEYHALGGYAILTLIVFRILWGFYGGTYARFREFVRGPGEVLHYAVSLNAVSLIGSRHSTHRGHNPPGGWSVLAMLASLLVQAGTGLFANDEIMMEGPLARHVSSGAGELATAIHDINAVVLLILIAVHIAAVLFHLLAKKENLIVPMITGRKRARAGDQPARYGSLALAAALLGCSAAAVYLLIRI